MYIFIFRDRIHCLAMAVLELSVETRTRLTWNSQRSVASATQGLALQVCTIMPAF